MRKGEIMMSKRMMMIYCLFCVGLLPLSANAENFVIKDYLFTWHIIEAGDVTMDIQKSPQGLAVILWGAP